MNPELQTAFLLLLVGMITVFFMLGIIIIAGLFLIRFINRFYPGTKSALALSPSGSTHPLDISEEEIAAIGATVEWLTGGKGMVERIVKKDEDK